MMKIVVLATAASLAMLWAAAAADLPRKEPPPPPPPVGKAPIRKYPVGKAPIGNYPQPVLTKGWPPNIRAALGHAVGARHRRYFDRTAACRLHAVRCGV